MYSQTITQNNTRVRNPSSSTTNQEPNSQNRSGEVLHLTLTRPPARVQRTIRQANNTLRVEWDETAIDNENMNKKKSKKCCIFKKKRKWDESSDESDWEDRYGEDADPNYEKHHHDCEHHNHEH